MSERKVSTAAKNVPDPFKMFLTFYIFARTKSQLY